MFSAFAIWNCYTRVRLMGKRSRTALAVRRGGSALRGRLHVRVNRLKRVDYAVVRWGGGCRATWGIGVAGALARSGQPAEAG